LVIAARTSHTLERRPLSKNQPTAGRSFELGWPIASVPIHTLPRDFPTPHFGRPSAGPVPVAHRPSPVCGALSTGHRDYGLNRHVACRGTACVFSASLRGRGAACCLILVYDVRIFSVVCRKAGSRSEPGAGDFRDCPIHSGLCAQRSSTDPTSMVCERLRFCRLWRFTPFLGMCQVALLASTSFLSYLDI
jgi:hypothetical protein